jgi:uncharacterized protein YbjT (DUF2867 family)
MTVLAVTGATGFVGGHVLDQAAALGLELRALTRRAQPPRHGVTWVSGTLDDADALDQCMAGADAVLHIAGVINAPDEQGFITGNVTGTAQVMAAAQRANIQRFIHVSSLAAREPALSAYGRSKAQSETLLQASALDWTIVRPPAVYGPGDRETLELYRMAKHRVVMLPPGGRLSLIEAGDLARLLLRLIDAPASIGALYEPDDGRSGGWAHDEFAHCLGAALDRQILPLAVPRRIMEWASRVDVWLRGNAAKLTADRVAYFCHPDWVCRPEHQPPADIWAPLMPTERGTRLAARWYREQGWL